MKWIDSHCHLNDKRFKKDLAEVLQRALEAEMEALILISASYEDCFENIKLREHIANQSISVYMTVGVHPHSAEAYTEEMHHALDQWLLDRQCNKVVALGEIGLDYYYDFSPKESQKRVFRQQLDLAYQHDIPIVLHMRDASLDCLTILKEYKDSGKLRKNPGTCHCFSGSLETAKALLALDFYFGFDGPITFKNNRKAREIIEFLPLEKILVETDAPYLTPEPFRGQRNEPAFIPYILERIAQIKQLPVEQVAARIVLNTYQAFEINP